MKKILAIALSVVMLLSLGVVFASAASAPGTYVTSEDTYQSVGNLPITWDPEVSEKLDLKNGEMSDWVDAGYTLFTISPENMISWVDVAKSADPNTTSMPENWNLTAYFVADKDYLYIGFYIVDDDVVLVSNPAGYDGDAFQMAIDFDYALGKFMEADPDLFPDTQCIFYSFGPTSTEAAPITLQTQNTDGNDSLLSEENGDGVIGSTGMTENGWCAEFAISWEQLYGDFTFKAYADDYTVYVGQDDNLDVGCALYYLNRDSNEDGTPNRTVTWAAGTLKGQEAGVAPEVTWGPRDNGMNMFLEWSAELEFTCENIYVLEIDETRPPETEAPTEEPTVAPETEEPTVAPETEAPTEAGTSVENKTEAGTQAEEGGCASVIGSVAVILTAAAAAVVLKKKD